MKSLVAFVGFKASGKNTAAEALYPHGFSPMSFADAMKDALASIFCWDRDMLEGITPESRQWRETVDLWWAEKLDLPCFTPRWAMQNFGTEVMRQHFHQQIWVLNVERRLSLVPSHQSVALLDCRYPNEITLARQFGGKVYRIKRGAEPDWMPLALNANVNGDAHDRAFLNWIGVHESEFAWIGTPSDNVIENDGSIAELHEKVRSIVLETAI